MQAVVLLRSVFINCGTVATVPSKTQITNKLVLNLRVSAGDRRKNAAGEHVVSRMGLSSSCARRRPRPQAGHGFSYAVNSSFPHRNLKFNLVVSADWRAYTSLTG